MTVSPCRDVCIFSPYSSFFLRARVLVCVCVCVVRATHVIVPSPIPVLTAISDVMSTGSALGTLPGGVSTLLPVEMQEYQAAANIQRIARGRQARKAVARRRRRFNRAATKIQARVRGMRDRERVLGIRRREGAATNIQRIVRGKLTRENVHRIVRRNLENASATSIQACLRGHFGRKRMRAKRAMTAATRLAVEAADTLKAQVCCRCCCCVRLCVCVCVYVL